MASGRKLVFRDRGAEEAAAPAKVLPWPILVVDDDDQVHEMTRVVLRDLDFEGRPFHCIHARSAAEASTVLEQMPDIPVVLLDVVMETPDAGLQLVRRIRETLGNRDVRIILRTGQPGDAPEREVVLAYDINDYKSKADLTSQRMFTALVAALRAWRDITTIARLNTELAMLNAGLERRVAERTRQLEEANSALGRSKERAETALARESEAKTQLRQFLSMVSHEFRTPLAIIDSSAQMLRLRGERGDPGSLPRIDTIRSGVQRLLGLIDTCLADEQLDSGRIILHEKVFDLAPMLDVTLSQHRVATPSHTYVLEGETPLIVWGDPGMVALIMNNLIGNAAKYSPGGSVVRVQAAYDGGDVVVRVVDQGIGIPADELGRVFERFHRASNVGGIPGSGIGLHMVRQIIEMHGGSISVESEVGRGSRFILRLRRPPPNARETTA